jgi:hypothetical protein
MRAHLFGDATRGRRFRLGSQLWGCWRHDCVSTAQRHDPRAGSLSLGGLIELTLMHTGAQLGDHVGSGAELGREN